MRRVAVLALAALACACASAGSLPGGGQPSAVSPEDGSSVDEAELSGAA
jgi:hypothetical protein